MAKKIDTIKNVKSTKKSDILSDVEKYDKKTQREHILLRPDTYIGYIEPTNDNMWIYSPDEKLIIKKNITFTPGFLKIFDETLVNARDASINDNTCDTIKVEYNILENYISVYNNGDIGIPIDFHPIHKTLIPSMIFGELLTSSNYNDSQERIVGGRNGLGSKVTNVFSTKFIVEIDDAKRLKRYKQVWENNMLIINEAEITKLPLKTKSSVKITFYPDYERFGMNDLNNDHLLLFHKRTMDIAGTSNKLKVFFNDVKIDINNFKSYIELYYPNSEIYYDTIDRWSVGVLYKPDLGDSISFVNSINTYRGGTHSNYVIDNIIKILINDFIKKKNKDIKITPSLLKENLIFFINSTIVNPAFSSQTKDTLETKIDKFGSKYEPNISFIKKLSKSGIIELVMDMAKFKETNSLKKTDGKKQIKISGIPKLEDANNAGTKKSKNCYLILTEGDSAKATAMSGLSEVGRDNYGVFPLKGKLLNVRDAMPKQLAENEEIKNLKLILGLKQNEDYSVPDKFDNLRYGHILLLTDSDSVAKDTPLLLQNNNNLIELRTIDNISKNWEKIGDKEISTTIFKIWTEKGWTEINKVIRHKVSKKIYRIVTNSGCVDVTEDHSLINNDGNEISPKDCKIGDKLLHSFPIFSDYSIEQICEMNNCELQKLAIKLNINNYLTNDELVNSITHLLSIYNIPMNNFNMMESEAYLFGYLWDCNDIISIEILNSPKNIKEYFIKGYYDANLNKEYNTNIIDFNKIITFKLVTNNKLSAQCLYLLCESIGYNISISIDQYNLNTYSLFINKNNQNNQTNITLIKQIIDLGVIDDYVYDLETVNHHFQAGIGKLIVHNTDGIHIKGLIMNFIHYFWPSLINKIDFINSLNTPIVKATHNKIIKEFFTIYEYEKWKNNDSDANNYKIKYYKGLGTSTSQEAKEYFKNLNDKLIKYYCKTNDSVKIEDITNDENQNEENNDENQNEDNNEDNNDENEENLNNSENSDKFIINYDDDNDAIKLAFDKSRTNDRKKWYIASDNDNKKELILSDNDNKIITLSRFVHNELSEHIKADNIRSIPSVIDGFKPSQRKILFGAFKRELDKDEVKVSQLAGFVSDKAAYHHGEMSLNGAIIGMAQNFVGSNNINILKPNGQFGCLSPDTKILLWDGSIKSANNIKVGDKLIGDDGTERTVLELTNGIDDMYEIESLKGPKFIANSEHILTLKFIDNNIIKWKNKLKVWELEYFDGNVIKKIRKKTNLLNEQDKYLEIKKIQNENILKYNCNEIIDIKLKNFLNLSKYYKFKLKMIVNNNIIKWPYQEIIIDPYKFGCLINNYKVIPQQYIINNINTRLELLAGIIDIYGDIINNNGIPIISILETDNININILESIKFIAQSLGFNSNIKNNFIKEIFNNQQKKVIITGSNLNIIPTKINKIYYQCNKYINYNINSEIKCYKNIYNLKIKSYTNTYNFKINYLGKNNFCGWQINNNQRFLLANFIITHNSILRGGKDAASSRYIWTMFEDLTTLIYNPLDNPILKPQFEDGISIEPKYYVPIIPMILVNGSEGIGTGFSTKIPPFNPIDIINNIKNMINNKPFEEMIPWWEGFNGSVIKINNNTYNISGNWKIDNNKIIITELPVGEWTSNYKEFIEKILDDNSSKITKISKLDDKKKTIKKKSISLLSYIDNNTDNTVYFELTFENGYLETTADIDKIFHLTKKYTINNMHLFDHNNIIKKYNNIEDILKDYYYIRLDFYKERKIYQLNILEFQLKLLSYKVKFILMIINKEIDINNKKRNDIEIILETNEFPKLSKSLNDDKISYDYLLSMPIYNLTNEKIEEFKKNQKEKETEYNDLQHKTENSIWLDELNILETKYIKWINKKNNDNKSDTNNIIKNKTKIIL